MEIIDARHKMNATKLKAFFNGLSENEEFLAHIDSDVPINDVLLTKDKMRDYIVNEISCKQLDKNIDIYFVAENVTLVMWVLDFVYWQNEKRISKLFDNNEEQKTEIKKSKSTSRKNARNFNIIVKYKDDEATSETFEGIESDAIEWVNRLNKIYTIRGFYNKVVVFSINGSEFMTLKELEKKDILTLQKGKGKGE